MYVEFQIDTGGFEGQQKILADVVPDNEIEEPTPKIQDE